MDVDSLWTNILGEVELEISHGFFLSFLRQTKLTYDSAERKATVFCQNQNSAIMIGGRYAPLIKRHLEKRLETVVDVEFRAIVQELTTEQTGPLFTATGTFEQTVRERGLNPLYSFENFAVSETNQMAFAAARAVAEKPGTSYNPLLLWGSTGVGKTHLVQAIGRGVLNKQPDARLLYCTGEEFTNEIIEAIRSRTTGSFKRRFRTLQLLLVDDVQFIAGRETVQMEFFHTFNSILHAGGQVVLSSDKPPSDINKLEARLRSRFEGGLTVDISPPNFELRTAILLIKAKERGVHLPIDDAKQISSRVEDVRAIEGLLLRYMSEQDRGTSGGSLLSRVLKTDILPLEKRSLSPLKVIDVVAGHYGLKVSQLTGQSRKRAVVEPRQILMYILRQELGLEFNRVGELLGGRDHTTIMHGVEKISSLLPKNEAFRKDVSSIRLLLSE